MQKSDLPFYHAYEDFYAMTEQSAVFSTYCKAVYGADFSQDGFSDVAQIDRFLSFLPSGGVKAVLDIGCGNGKMLRYVQDKTQAAAYGFDYSEKAIAQARRETAGQSGTFHFQVDTLDSAGYPPDQFDAITATDSVYFTENMPAFLKKAIGWLRQGGIFFCGYQEGDVMAKTPSPDSSVFAKALRELGIPFQTFDYTKQTYHLLRRKRQILERMKDDFLREGLERWYEVARSQSLGPEVGFPLFSSGNSRYLYLVRKSAEAKHQ